jgi:hypothetical protein
MLLDKLGIIATAMAIPMCQLLHVTGDDLLIHF